MTDKISANCKTTYIRQPLDGHRSESQIKWIVLHDTEGGNARNIARYFQSATAGYAHLTMDENYCFRSLANTAIPRGAPGANQKGFHIEQCGYAKWTRSEWLAHIRTLRRAAYKTAFHCKRFGIPVTFLDYHGLIAGKKGITTHAECSKAFGGDHTDPGAGWPRSVFMGMVRAYRLTLH